LYTSPKTCSSASCKSSTSLINSYHPLFDNYGVDLVLQGHIHNYQRTYPIEYNLKNPTKPTITSKSTSKYNDPPGEIFVVIGTGGINFHGLTGKSSFVATCYKIWIPQYQVMVRHSTQSFMEMMVPLKIALQLRNNY
ncbi:MAG: hypothetical protein WCE93_00350, partial [Nitrososphaeraceae archaeon]